MQFLLFSAIFVLTSTVTSDVCNTDEGKSELEIGERFATRFRELVDRVPLSEMLEDNMSNKIRSELYTNDFQFLNFNRSKPHNQLKHHFFCASLFFTQTVQYHLICAEFYENNQKLNFTVVRGCGAAGGKDCKQPLPVWRHYRFSARKVDGLFRIFYGHEDYKLKVDYSGNPFHDC